MLPASHVYTIYKEERSVGAFWTQLAFCCGWLLGDLYFFAGDEHDPVAAGPPVGAYRRRTDLLPTIVTPREQRTSTPGRAASLSRIDRLAPVAAPPAGVTGAHGRPQHVSMCNLAARSRTRSTQANNPHPASKPNPHGRVEARPAVAQRTARGPSTSGRQPAG